MTSKIKYTKLDIQGAELPILAKAWSMVKDNTTKLIWEVKTNDGTIHDKNNEYNWKDAQDIFITEVNVEKFGGFSDWRLPTIEELQSIVNRETYDPAINTAYFPNTIPSGYWSSTTDAHDTDYAWLVNFYYGVVSIYYRKSGTFYVRAVRSG